MWLLQHPYPPFILKNTTKIIVGTIPPYRFSLKKLKKGDVNFCYGSADGYLWKILNEIYSMNLEFKNSLKAIQQRKKFLAIKKIGICDIVASCKREKLDAADLGMKNIQLREILDYLNTFSKIKTLIFTGGNSKNGPEYLFRQLLSKYKISLKIENDNTPKKHSFIWNKNLYFTYSLTSPSPSANKFIGTTKIYKINKKQNANYTTFDFRIEQYKKIFDLP